METYSDYKEMLDLLYRMFGLADSDLAAIAIRDAIGYLRSSRPDNWSRFTPCGAN